MIYGFDKLQYLTIVPAGAQDVAKLYLSLPFVLTTRAIRRPLLPSWKIRVRTEESVISLRPGVANLAIACKGFETETRKWFRFRKGETFLDIGANVGYYSVKALRAGCRVVAVEPDPSNCELLRLNAPQATVVEAALSDSEGNVAFYSHPDASLSSLTPRQGAHQIDVRMWSIDKLCDRLALDRLDWIKIDAEFHEREILAGGKEALRRAANLVVEVSAGNMAPVRGMLGDFGMRVIASEFFGDSTNVLAVRA